MEKRRIRNQRRMQLARKYFDRWVEYTIGRKNVTPNELHISLWDIEEDVDKMLAFLQKKSGYGMAGILQVQLHDLGRYDMLISSYFCRKTGQFRLQHCDDEAQTTRRNRCNEIRRRSGRRVVI